MFSTKELVIKLTTQNAPPIKVVTRQPNRVTRAEDRCPVKKAKAIPTEPSHAKPSNKTSHMLLFFSFFFFLFQVKAMTKMTKLYCLILYTLTSVCVFFVNLGVCRVYSNRTFDIAGSDPGPFTK